MADIMLDTSVCIRVLRTRSPALEAHFKAKAGRLCISTVAVSELQLGSELSARPDHHAEKVDDLLSRLLVLDFDREAAAHAADIRAFLRRKGTPIGAMDSLIGAHARSRGCMLITGNLGEFGRVPGLPCEDWDEGVS